MRPDKENVLQWQVLNNLRTRFLDQAPESKAQDYWDSVEVLDLYDQTFAQRIGWKWLAVLDELSSRSGLEIPNSPKILDWGCGSGIATRTFLKYAEKFSISNPQILFFDRSKKAQNFAIAKVREEFLNINAQGWDSQKGEPDILLVSHVLNEIDDAQLVQLKQLVLQSALTIWVEPGTYEVSRRLLECREFFKDALQILAPCPQRGACPMTQEKYAHDWCHNFAPVPAEVFHSAFWNSFSKNLKIDLRSLPVSFLVLSGDNKNLQNIPNRIIGKPKKFKPFQKVFVCEKEGVLVDGEITKRRQPALYKQLDKQAFCVSLPDDITLQNS